MLHHRTNTTFTPFHFTGKEKDPETGYSYFGARYLEHELMTGWLSVDPMSDKYPSISPYAYCAWNPVKLVDPDGKEIWIVNKSGVRTKYSQGMSSEGFDNYTAETINALNKLCTTKILGFKLGILCKSQQFVIDVVENNEETFWVPELYKDFHDCLPENQTIDFSPYLGIEDIFTGEIMSPANCLGHEFGHIISAIEDTKVYLDRKSRKRSDEWTNDEELHNITNIEHKISLEWNELIRKGHKTTDGEGVERYRVIHTEGSTSTQKIDL